MELDKVERLVADIERSHNLVVSGLDRWWRCGVGTASQKKASAQIDRNEAKFHAALSELKRLTSNA